MKKKALFLFTLLAILIGVPILSVGTGCLFVSVPESPGPQKEISIPEDIAGYARPEFVSYLTYTEWNIVYGSEEYADVLRQGSPVKFPYFRSIIQLWSGYCSVTRFTNREYGFSPTDHLMLWVIGTSFSVENAVKGIYENTTGRFAEALGGYRRTPEENFAAEMNTRYVRFIYDRPFYEYGYAAELKRLWTEVPMWGRNPIRSWERRWFLSAELAIKAVYGKLILTATHSLFGIAETEVYARVAGDKQILKAQSDITLVREESDETQIIEVPRYRLFTEIVPRLVLQGIRFEDISGNDEIFVTILVPSGWKSVPAGMSEIFRTSILTQPGRERVGLRVPVADLHSLLAPLDAQGAELEHLYDY